MHTEQITIDTSSDCRNKRLQCYNWWKETEISEQLIKNYIRTYDNIWRIATGQGNDYTTGCLLDYIISKIIITW